MPSLSKNRVGCASNAILLLTIISYLMTHYESCRELLVGPIYWIDYRSSFSHRNADSWSWLSNNFIWAISKLKTQNSCVQSVKKVNQIENCWIWSFYEKLCSEKLSCFANDPLKIQLNCSWCVQARGQRVMLWFQLVSAVGGAAAAAVRDAIKTSMQWQRKKKKLFLTSRQRSIGSLQFVRWTIFVLTVSTVSTRLIWF